MERDLIDLAGTDLTEPTIDLRDPVPGTRGAGGGQAGEVWDDTERQRALGDRLRRIRRQQGLSLADVEQRSGGEWKAVVIGAYERGDRAVTVAKLARLADFYGVPLPDLLPPSRRRTAGTEPDRLVLDLTRLEADGDEGIGAVVRFADRIQRLRGDHNGRVLTLRGEDVQTLAVAVGEDPGALVATLRSRGAVLDA
jgi:transcriptional regulator with XRE-family HTH domain